MKTSTRTFFFISGGVLFTLLIANQVSSYIYMNKMTSEFSSAASANLKLQASELTSEIDKSKSSGNIGTTDKSKQTSSLASYSKLPSLAPTSHNNVVQANDAAKSANQPEAEIAKLNEQLTKTQSDYTDIKDSLSHCANIENMADRLDCYDKMTHQKEHFGEKQDSKQKSWAIRKNISPIDDSTSISLTASARESFQAYGKKTLRPFLSLTCDPVSSTVMFSTGQYFSTGNHNFETRIGKNKSNVLSWRMDKQGKSAYLEMHTKDFIKQLVFSDRLAIQIGAREVPNNVLTFDLTGLADENEELRKFCGV